MSEANDRIRSRENDGITSGGSNTRDRSPLAIARRHKWLGAAAVVLTSVLAAWIALKAREEWTIRSDARMVRSLISAGQFEQASEPLERWMRARPGSGDAAFLAARCELGLLSYAAGFADLDRVLKLGYSIELIERERGIALSRLGRHAEAEPILSPSLPQGHGTRPRTR